MAPGPDTPLNRIGARDVPRGAHRSLPGHPRPARPGPVSGYWLVTPQLCGVTSQ